MNPQDQNSNVPKMPVPKDDSDADNSTAANPALDMIRQKLEAIYSDAPSASKEIEEIRESHRQLSKHQKFVLELQKSGKSPSEIQSQWHNYYLSQPDHEKNTIWEEFYAANKQIVHHPAHHQTPAYTGTIDLQSPIVVSREFLEQDNEPVAEKRKTAAQIKREVLKKVTKHQQKKWWQGLHSLLFGLGIGFFVLLLLMFSFFNETIIAPFITPSSTISAQSLIIDPNGTAVSANPIIIIPKINVELPVIYTVPTIDENQIENNLENGVVHYPTTAYPGQLGNGAIFGHSSNNILNPGKYKFAFVLLHDLQVGDTFTLDYQGVAYVYQVFQRNIVPPNDVSVLNDIPGHAATFTLITCDPPGTSINRLVVAGDQISPSPTANTAGPNQNNAVKPSVLPSNSPSLWSRILSIF